MYVYISYPGVPFLIVSYLLTSYLFIPLKKKHLTTYDSVLSGIFYTLLYVVVSCYILSYHIFLFLILSYLFKLYYSLCYLTLFSFVQ